MEFTIKDKGVGLCFSCKHATIIKFAYKDRGIFCHKLGTIEGPGRIPEGVLECNEYASITTKYLYEMEEIAWKLDLKKLKKGKPGFSAPKEED